MEKQVKEIGTCPLCGGKVIKTCKGYRCENGIGENASCSFYINGIIGNRRMSDDEIKELILKKELMLDGFATKEWKTFPTVLILDDKGEVKMESKIGKCPVCGGDIRIGSKAFNCSHYNNDSDPCKFVIWRNIFGHSMTLGEVRELCRNEITANEIELFGEDGSLSVKRLGISPDKTKIIKV